MSSVLGQLETKSFWEHVIQTRMAALISVPIHLFKSTTPNMSELWRMDNVYLCIEQRTTNLAVIERYVKACSMMSTLPNVRKNKAYPTSFTDLGSSAAECILGLAVWSGWSKNLFPALEYKISATLIISLGVFCLSVLPFILLAKNGWALMQGLPYEPTFLALETLTCAVILVTDAYGHYREGYRWYYAWSLPLAMSIVIGMFMNSAWRIVSGRGTAWKGE